MFPLLFVLVFLFPRSLVPCCIVFGQSVTEVGQRRNLAQGDGASVVSAALEET